MARHLKMATVGAMIQFIDGKPYQTVTRRFASRQ